MDQAHQPRHPGRRAAASRDLSNVPDEAASLMKRLVLHAGQVPALRRRRASGRDDVRVALLVAASLAAAAPVLAQEPDHLERLAGVCRTQSNVTLGRYSGRVLWLVDGQLSGMLTQESEGSGPRSLTIAKQTPESIEDGFVLRARAFIASPDGEQQFEAPVLCTVSAAPAERSDPGATSRG